MNCCVNKRNAIFKNEIDDLKKKKTLLMANDSGRYSDIGKCIFRYEPESKKIIRDIEKKKKVNKKLN